jgi:phospholipid/cholesterol/gamma-HCH transport system ATP-binding protein
LDDLIIEINRSLNATVVIVTHELMSIFAIANNAVFWTRSTRKMGANGHPKKMLEMSDNQNVIQFLTRGESPGMPVKRT